MKKAFLIVFLLTVIAGSGAFSVLYISFNLTDPANSINTNLRKHVLKHPIPRKLLRLQQVGDARYEYMHQRSRPFEIYLYYQEHVSLEQKTLVSIQREMQFITHKYAGIRVHDPIVISGVGDKIDDEDINAVLDAYAADTPILSHTVPLHIFLLGYYLPHPSYAGIVSDAHSIVLFKDAIINVSESQQSREAVEISTILHEFGHLAGADHIENSDCIMADTVENLNFFNKISTIRTSYCEEDVQAIQQALEI